MDDSVSAVSAGTKIMKAPERMGPASSGVRILNHLAKNPRPDADAASSIAGSTVKSAVVLPLICSTRYLVM